MKTIRTRTACFLACMALLLTGCHKVPIDNETSNTEQTDTSDSSETSLSGSEAETTTSGNPESSDSTNSYITTTPGSSDSSPTTAPDSPNPSETTAPTNPTETKEWNQTFILSSFMALDGSLDITKNKKVLQNSRDGGLNMVEVTWLSTEESILAALDAAEAVGGIQLLVQNARGIGDVGTNLGGMGNTHTPKAIVTSEVENWAAKLSAYSCLAGYYVWDEPTSNSFNVCKQLTSIYKRVAPNKLAFSCVFPSYGNYRWPADYPAYVDQYIRTVNPQVLSVDYYPFQSQSSIKTTSDLWRDMGYMRKKSLEAGIPYWHYFQATKNGASLSVEQIQVQMMACLAYGVKGMSYFTSQNCLTNSNGAPTANYNALKAVNFKARNIGDLLFDKTNAALYQTGLSTYNNNIYYLNALGDSPWINSAPDNLIIGVFTDSSNTYLAVVNKDHTASIQGRLELKNAFSVSQYMADINETRSLSDSSSSIDLSIGAGDIAVFILS